MTRAHLHKYSSTVNVWILNDQNPHYTEIRTEGNLSIAIIQDFLVRISGSVWNLNCLGMEPKPAVWIPNQFGIQTFTVLHCTVDVRNPDVRNLNALASGFQRAIVVRNLNTSNWMLGQTVLYIYSECLKSGRPDFGVFHFCPVVKSSGFRTSGPFTLQCPDFECPVPNVRIDQNRF